MTQTGFSDIASAMHPDGEGYAAQIPSHWRQGRTAYGGITAGLAYEIGTRQVWAASAVTLNAG